MCKFALRFMLPLTTPAAVPGSGCVPGELRGAGAAGRSNQRAGFAAGRCHAGCCLPGGAPLRRGYEVVKARRQGVDAFGDCSVTSKACKAREQLHSQYRLSAPVPSKVAFETQCWLILSSVALEGADWLRRSYSKHVRVLGAAAGALLCSTPGELAAHLVLPQLKGT